MESQPTETHGNQWVTFELSGPSIVEDLALNINIRAWDADPLGQPPQLSSVSRVSPEDLKITRSETFDYFRRLAGEPVLHFEMKHSRALPSKDETTRPGPGRPSDGLGLMMLNGSGFYCIPDGDLPNIVDPKAMTLRRINLGKVADAESSDRPTAEAVPVGVAPACRRQARSGPGAGSWRPCQSSRYLSAT